MRSAHALKSFILAAIASDSSVVACESDPSFVDDSTGTAGTGGTTGMAGTAGTSGLVPCFHASTCLLPTDAWQESSYDGGALTDAPSERQDAALADATMVEAGQRANGETVRSMWRSGTHTSHAGRRACAHEVRRAGDHRTVRVRADGGAFSHRACKFDESDNGHLGLIGSRCCLTTSSFSISVLRNANLEGAS